MKHFQGPRVSTPLLSLIFLASLSLTITIPGITLEHLKLGQHIPIYASDLRDYNLFYYFCESERTITIKDSIIDRIFDDSIHQMHFKASAGINSYCRRFCHKPIGDLKANKLILDRVKFTLKGLPGWMQDEFGQWSREVPLIKEDKSIENLGNGSFVTHFRFIIRYNTLYKQGSRYIKPIDFEIQTKSINSKPSMSGKGVQGAQTYGCNFGDDVFESPSDDTGHVPKKLFFTYDIIWEHEKLNKKFITHWDKLQTMTTSDELRQFFGSVLLTTSLVLMLAVLLNCYVNQRVQAAQFEAEELHRLNTGRKPIPKTLKDAQKTTSWKFLAGDVFKAPEYALLFSATLGTGFQLFLMITITLLFLTVCFFWEEHRELFVIAAIFFYVCTGTVCGWISAFIYKNTGGENWLACALTAGLLYPAIGVNTIVLINGVLTYSKSSFQLTYFELFVVLSVWLGLFLPQVFIGAFLAFRRPKISLPGKISLVSRTIPPQPCLLSKPVVFMLGSVFPFVTIYLQLSKLGDIIWSDEPSNLVMIFLFMIISGITFSISCAITGALVTFLNLIQQKQKIPKNFLIDSGNHRWWWNSFLSTFGVGLYTFIYNFQIFETKKEPIRTVFFLLFNILVSGFVALMAGSMSTLGSFIFIKELYQSMRLEQLVKKDRIIQRRSLQAGQRGGRDRCTGQSSRKADLLQDKAVIHSPAPEDLAFGTLPLNKIDEGTQVVVDCGTEEVKVHVTNFEVIEKISP